MAAFIDDLALEYFLVTMVSVLTLYTIAAVYIEYRKNGTKNLRAAMAPAGFPLLVLGTVILLIGLFQEFVWPLPASFNIYFGDPFLMLGMVTLVYAIAVLKDYKLQYPGIFALFIGLMAVTYGYFGYINNLPHANQALETFILYLGYGAFGILVYPVSLIYDILPSRTKSPFIANLILVIFFFLVLLAMVASTYGGLVAVGSHIASAP
ncbi:MAG: DUF981 family protein [Candidatus Thermoplasmatota archaeon]|jgi:putative membrane protein|nr:DUF981 family protein [Candidatus Thermoplasmatota archaeon]MCL5800504.1 DUF981 family protein [Candidatus Thermoplasmatota archaeon]